ncbi:transglutaminase family protein [Roseococcus sp.]|uniref:transglutaminase family protein n=1 Tax=Roseococcus sp. TaxID=2109646 RepID=UPI003BACF152
MADPAPAAIHSPATTQTRDVLAVTHTTTYRYAVPVTLGPQRLMLRPHDSHDMRLLSATLTLSPVGKLRWYHDVFGNSIAMAEFEDATRELVIRSDLVVERFGDERGRDFAAEIAPEARNWPFLYSSDDRADLGNMMIAQYPDPGGRVLRWGQGFVAAYPTPTLGLLRDINASIQAGFTYRAREEAGTQTPLETLDGGSGTCRDFAVLMIETCRALGFGARLISGYLREPEESALLGAGSTHAWCEVYLPGAGWIPFDPTNGLMGSSDLIRVATVRDIRQAPPISGSFIGQPEDFLGMEVSVEVRRVDPGALPSL